MMIPSAQIPRSGSPQIVKQQVRYSCVTTGVPPRNAKIAHGRAVCAGEYVVIG
jgi:hypothetical protein